VLSAKLLNQPYNRDHGFLILLVVLKAQDVKLEDRGVDVNPGCTARLKIATQPCTALIKKALT
jgi:hypothetical protein